MLSNRNFIVTAVSIALVLAAALLVWFFFFRSTATVSTTGTASGGFGSTPDITNTAPASTDTNGTQAINTTTTAATQKIFKIIDGPIVGATLLQTTRPTTTIARYIRQDDGHVFDLPLGVAGAVPRVVSNITIPGGQRALWLEGGSAAIMQYVDDASVVKTVYLGFPAATTTGKVQPTRIQFLPDNIIDIASSPDGKSLVYLVKTANGSDGYTARDDGANSRKTFSLQLSQLLVSWPSQNTIMAETEPAAGVTGMAFAIDAKSGVATSLVAAAGLTAVADPTFANIFYQTTDGTTASSYLYNIKSGSNYTSSLVAYPEKCIWSHSQTTSLFCAVPSGLMPANYVDLWHQGIAAGKDALFLINFTSQTNTLIAAPGSQRDGGVASNILEMALSPNEKYLSFTTKGSRSLWGVLLSQ